MDQEHPRKKILQTHHILMFVFLGVALVAIIVGAYFYSQYTSLNNILKNPNVAVEKQTKQLTDQVGKLIMLPTDEQPTIATVTDASKLSDQAFFQNAKNGDKVLIYVKARKAILYDPTKNVIVDVAPVNIAQNQTAVPSGTAAAPTQAVIAPTKAVVAPASATTAVSPTPTQ